MTEAATTPSTDLAQLDRLRATPTNVADAFERLVRIDAVKAWLDDVKADIRDGYLTPQADEVEKATGGAFRTSVSGLGSVYRTDPQPKPVVASREDFARWIVADLAGEDPDAEPDEDDWTFTTPAGEVRRRLTASAPDSALLEFVNAHARSRTGDEHAPSGYADVLADRIVVDVEWLVSADVLEQLVDGKVAALESGVARVKVVGDEGDERAIDTATGADVPGVSVQPAGRKQLTVKPDADARKRVRAELNELLGPAALPR